MFNVPEHYRLIAQMPFGGIVQEAEPKEKEDITQRVKVFNG
jgi:predicted oxidoreductase (fatty acid repression mutant protein)